MITEQTGSYFGHKIEAIYRFGNKERNHNALLELFDYFWRFAHTNKVYVNDIDFREAFWDGPRRCIFEVDWIESDDWSTIENVPVTSEKYSEWTALITRAAETVALTISYPIYELNIESIIWLSIDRFAVTYAENR